MQLKRSPAEPRRTARHDPSTVPNGRSLPANAIWSVAGAACFAIGHWLTLVALARLGPECGPGIDAVGAYAFGATLALPILSFFGLQLRSLIATDPNGRFAAADYYRVRVLSLCVSIVLIAALASHYRSTVPIAVVLLTASVLVADSYQDLLFGFLQRANRLDYVGQSFILRGLSGPLTLAPVFLAGGTVECGLAACLAFRALVIVLIDCPRVAAILHSFPHHSDAGPPAAPPATAAASLRRLWPLVRTGLPLGATTGLIALETAVPRLAVERLTDTSVLGAFVCLMTLSTLVQMPILAIGSSTSSYLARWWAADQRRQFATCLGVLIGLSLAVGAAAFAVAVVIGPRLLTMIFGSDAAGLSTLLLPAIGVAVLRGVATPCGFAMTAAGRTAMQPVVYGATLLTVAVGCGLPLIGGSSGLSATELVASVLTALTAGGLVRLAAQALVLGAAFRSPALSPKTRACQDTCPELSPLSDSESAESRGPRRVSLTPERTTLPSRPHAA